MSIYLLAFSEAHQLLKLPVLVEHFREHRQSDPAISFLAFLKIHYTGIFVMDDDYQRDNELPFRTADCLGMISATICECPPAMEWPQPPENSSGEFIVTNDNNTPLIRPTDIFQPPRIA